MLIPIVLNCKTSIHCVYSWISHPPQYLFIDVRLELLTCKYSGILHFKRCFHGVVDLSALAAELATLIVHTLNYNTTRNKSGEPILIKSKYIQPVCRSIYNTYTSQSSSHESSTDSTKLVAIQQLSFDLFNTPQNYTNMYITIPKL
jgi:hypothetical protein